MIGMKINSQNAKKIDSYITDYKEQADLNDTEKVRIQDKVIKIDVFRLPLDYLFYNIENGRFAKEYLNLKKVTGELNPENSKDAKEIEKMLRGQSISKTQWLKDDIKTMGQQEYGIITHDGFVINGNRRMSVLHLLADENPDYGYMNVARLPSNVEESDIYKIELGKQMAREQKLDYGPINELLKIEHGIKSKLTSAQIAATIGYTKEEIEEKMARLELIRDYLDFIGEPDNFEAVDDINEHFIDLHDKIFSEKLLKQKRFNSGELDKIKNIAFATMKAKVPAKALRKIPKMVTNPKIRSSFFEAAKVAKPSSAKEALEIFKVCETRLQAETDKGKPAKLLNSILATFDSVDFHHPELKQEENKNMIKKIIEYMDNLKKFS
jgi:hypothetical protein